MLGSCTCVILSFPFLICLRYFRPSYILHVKFILTTLSNASHLYSYLEKTLFMLFLLLLFFYFSWISSRTVCSNSAGLIVYLIDYTHRWISLNIYNRNACHSIYIPRFQIFICHDHVKVLWKEWILER